MRAGLGDAEVPGSGRDPPLGLFRREEIEDFAGVADGAQHAEILAMVDTGARRNGSRNAAPRNSRRILERDESVAASAMPHLSCFADRCDFMPSVPLHAAHCENVYWADDSLVCL